MKKLLTILLLGTMIAFMPASSAARTPSKKGTKTANTSQVIFTGEIAKKVVGYNGPTPLNITINGGRITKIEVLDNQEGPGYLKRATAKVLPQFEGKTVAEALALDADIATGATYTSEALIKNIKMGLETVKDTKSKSKGKNNKISPKKKSRK